jgi:hypothetical protein
MLSRGQVSPPHLCYVEDRYFHLTVGDTYPLLNTDEVEIPVLYIPQVRWRCLPST